MQEHQNVGMSVYRYVRTPEREPRCLDVAYPYAFSAFGFALAFGFLATRASGLAVEWPRYMPQLGQARCGRMLAWQLGQVVTLIGFSRTLAARRRLDERDRRLPGRPIGELVGS